VFDASRAVHNDRHGRAGIVAMLAGCCFGSWTCKQKMLTLSSTESKIDAISDGVKNIMWFKRWLIAQGHEVGPVLV
jgi:hypothetical protein